MKKALILFVILTAVSSSCPSMVERKGNASDAQQTASSLEKRQADMEAIQNKLTRAEVITSTTPPTSGVVAVTPEPQVPGVTIAYPPNAPWWQQKTSSSSQVLVIPSPGMNGEEITSIREDLSIMSRILDRKTGLSTVQVMNSDERALDMYVAISRGSSETFRQGATESVFIAGFGALFSMKVDFPLLPPPEIQEQKKSDKDTDNLWEQTKKEIYSPGTNAPTTGWPSPRRQIRRPIYEAERVEELKAKLIESLKHAANIRSLKPDEWVVIAVTGQSNQPYVAPEEAGYGGFGMGGGYGGGGMYGEGGGEGYGGGGGMIGGYGGVQDQPAQTPILNTIPPPTPAGAEPEQTGKKLEYNAPTCLTIRAKKGDVDEFAKGLLTIEKFKQRLEISTY